MPSTKPFCRQAAVFLPRMEAEAGAERSIWGSWAVFWTSAACDSCGPGRMTPPTSSCFSFTAMMEMAVSAEMTASGPGVSASAATAPHKSSAPSWAGLSSRSLMPLFRPGPTVRKRAVQSIRSAARTRPVSAGTTLPRMPPSMRSVWTRYRESRFSRSMAYSSIVAAASECRRPLNCRASCSYPAMVMCVLPMLTVRIMVGASSTSIM